MLGVGSNIKGAFQRLLHREESKAADAIAMMGQKLAVETVTKDALVKTGQQVARDSLELSAAAAKEAAGKSEIGKAVNKAVVQANSGTVPRDKVLTKGSIEGLWINDHDLHNEAMDRLSQEILKAKNEVRIENFTFYHDSEAGKTLLDTLSKKQKMSPDFKVYVVYNGDFKPTSNKLADALNERGINAMVGEYNRIPHRGADHSKLFVLDGTTGLIGGINIQDKEFQDVLVKVKGDVVDTFLADFENAWNKSKVKFQTLNGKTLSADGMQLPKALKAETAAATGATVPMTFMSRQNIAIASLHGNPYANDADQGLLAAIRSAQNEIRIVTPNITDREVWKALEEAADRGVQIKLLIPKGFNQQTSLVDFSNNELFIGQFLDKLPERSRSNFEMRWFSPDGKTHASNHTKYMSVDSQWAYVGSQNMDKQSFVYSREAGLGIDDALQTRKLDEALFNQDWERGLRVTPENKPSLLESLGF